MLHVEHCRPLPTLQGSQSRTQEAVQVRRQASQSFRMSLFWRPQAYHEIEARLVTETVFSQYMYKTLPTSNHLWAFKKQFCVQMALSGARAVAS